MKKEKKQYSFKLLRDESVDTDSFEDKTHEGIAESILKLITTEEKGISIGLEGPWGSGKSTVVSILKRKLEKKNSGIPLIQFDAWAHEGDPLRRIFLESLIDEFSDEVKSYDVASNAKKELGELKEKIAHRQKVTKIKTTRTTTALGKWLSIALFLVPIGVAFLSSVNYPDSSFIGNPGWVLAVGLLLSAAPLLVVVGNLIRILCNKDLKKKGVFTLKNWSFLQDVADQEMTQEVSEEDERSSIEFERYFNEVMEMIFKNSEIKKLVLVIDNLDRIDVNDALKIWSTLQTFLSQRTQTWHKKEWFDKIWIIVPYDSEGLSRLWNRSLDGTNQNLSKPFFDKCFQLRIEVPKPIFTGWEAFAKHMIDYALEGWEQDDKDELIRIIRMTRKDLTDTPTPREIKNYINQVGFLASQWGDAVSISSIAYYVCLRELAGVSIEEIKSKLIENELIDSKHKALLPETCTKDIAGIIFGVTPDKGFQLLLEPEIASALRNGNGESLKTLSERHGEGFWHVFNYHLEHQDIDINTAITSAKAIHEGVWKDNSKKCESFVTKVSRIDLSPAPKEIKWDDEVMDKYICLIKICHKEKTFIQDLYLHLIDCIRSSINKDKNIEWKEIINGLYKITGTIKTEIKIPQQRIDKLSLYHLITLIKTSSALEYEAYKWLAPTENIVEEIAESIVAGQVLGEGLAESVEYTLKAGINQGWDTVLVKCKQYVNWNNGNYKNQSDDIFKIINIITFRLHSQNEINQLASDIANSGHYHNLFWHRRTQNSAHAALLCGYVFKDELQSKTIHKIGNSTAGFNEIKKFWAQSNSDNARKVLEELKRFNLWSFIWDLLIDEKNQLVNDIVIMALDDKNASDLFHVNDCLEKLRNFSGFIEGSDDRDEKVLKLIEKFTEHANLEDEIVSAERLDLIGYAYELYMITKRTYNTKLITKIAEELRNINKENWLEALKEDTYLTSLALEARGKQKEFCLKNDFIDALIEFVTSKPDYSGWQKEHWNEIISLLDDSFQEYYRKNITDYLSNNPQTILIDTFNLNKEYFVYEKVLENRENLQNAFDDSVKSRDIPRLQLLNEILSKDVEGKFKPEDYFIDVIKKPLQDLYQQQDDEEIKSGIKSLAEKLSIDILESSEMESEGEE